MQNNVILLRPFQPYSINTAVIVYDRRTAESGHDQYALIMGVSVMVGRRRTSVILAWGYDDKMVITFDYKKGAQTADKPANAKIPSNEE